MSICIELVHDYYFNKEHSSSFPEDLVFRVLTAAPRKYSQGQMYGYYWNVIAEGFLKNYSNRGLELLEKILSNSGQVSRFGSLDHIANIADRIVITHPAESWEIVSNLINLDTPSRYDVIEWLRDTGFEEQRRKGAISYMPELEIINWVKEDRENRLWLIEGILPKTLDENSGGLLTRHFIEEFGNDQLDSSLFVHFHMGSWSGPESAYLSKIRDSARKWISEIKSTKIQIWLGKFIDYLSSQIEIAQIREERRF